MEALARSVTDGVIVLLLLGGVALFRAPRTARLGNGAAALALAAAILLVLHRKPVHGVGWLVLALVIGGGLGLAAAYRVNMLQIPAMIAFQHGAGGLAAVLISLAELWRIEPAGISRLGQTSGVLGLALGAATFSGSLVASGKLMSWLRPTPILLPAHGFLAQGVAAAVVASGLTALIVQAGNARLLLLVLVGLSVLLGVLIAVRIGGADMPVLISFLNATSGFAAAFCGVILSSPLLVACGAVVAASGSILTQVMCRAMNRRLWQVFLGFQTAGAQDAAGLPASATTAVLPATAAPSTLPDAPARAAKLLETARRVILVPGYGMAVAQAQAEVVRLARWLQSRGAAVCFAIHPVAGRMPGHMNVLLAEADVDYDLLKEMDEINPEFSRSDVALVVGACDVVNPAARTAPNTPISGMPILQVSEAAHVVVCNLDERPGYSGVPNPLYRDPKTVLLLGDAKASLQQLLTALGS